MNMDVEREGIEETQPWKEESSGGAVKTTQIDGDISVGRDVAIGGNTKMQGGALVKGNVKILGWLIAHNIKGCYKGLFVTPQKLREAYPHSHKGWWALVGKSVPGAVWVDDHGEWVATGEIGVDPEDALNQMTAKKYTDEKTAETLQAAKDYHNEHEEQLREEMDDADRAIRGEMAEADRAIREEFAAADAGIIADYQAADRKITEDYKAGDKTTLDSSKNYADTRDAEQLATLKKYSDDKDKDILAQAKKYSDERTEESLYPVPVGTILIWPGTKDNVPMGYMMCNGDSIRKDEYPELYAIIGDNFNNKAYMKYGSEGFYNNPPEGYFRLPDLQERFIVGSSSFSTEYQYVGTTGGERTHILTISEMPRHDHQIKFSDERKWGDNANTRAVPQRDGSSKRTTYTQQEGSSLPHENRPPYYTLIYIIRVK